MGSAHIGAWQGASGTQIGAWQDQTVAAPSAFVPRIILLLVLLISIGNMPVMITLLKSWQPIFVM